ncbi:hypothetical protein J1N35_019346 [Gossypium stocksii]|uniref:Ribulose bisphosphate carboxylase large chain n=1 Tax=Gossypium stocksii TaxID=47602 RepID=A0A9D3VR66_9ROSI|nr:hypothetical protein J1N35_019346 [Gossypium stocksii]
MSPQTETKASVGFKVGVKEYKLTYYTPKYEVKDTDILATFRVTPQPRVPPEEARATIAAESSTGTWTTVWTDGLTSLDRYKGRCYHIEPVPGEEDQYICYVAYPLNLFEEGSVTNMFTSIVGNVFGFKALRALCLEDLRIPTAYIKTFQGPPHGIQVERDKLNKHDNMIEQKAEKCIPMAAVRFHCTSLHALPYPSSLENATVRQKQHQAHVPLYYFFVQMVP